MRLMPGINRCGRPGQAVAVANEAVTNRDASGRVPGSRRHKSTVSGVNQDSSSPPAGGMRVPAAASEVPVAPQVHPALAGKCVFMLYVCMYVCTANPKI